MANSPQWALRLLEDYKQEILGIHELTGILGVSKQGLSNRVTRGKMKPTVHLAMGPIWTKEDVRAYLTRPRDQV